MTETERINSAFRSVWIRRFSVDELISEEKSNASNLASREPRLLRGVPDDLPSALRQVIDYRKSGLSLNHIVGCPLDCGYCVRHLFDNYDMKQPHLVMDDRQAVDELLSHWAFQPNITPLQIFNRATDPFLPGVKEHLFSTLENLDARALTNHVLVITRWHVEAEDIRRLERLKHLKLTILVTWSGINDRRVEPVDSAIAERSLRTLFQNASRTRAIFYWRPIIAGLNDTDDHLLRAAELSNYAHATVFTGLFFREQIREHFRQIGVPDLYEEIARRKILPAAVESRVLEAMKDRALFRKTSCGVSFAHSTADFNGHYAIRELCEICPKEQQSRCMGAHSRPESIRVAELASLAGLNSGHISIDDRCIEVDGSSEQQRYFMQHSLNFQVHDRAHPHRQHRHGRAEVGWS